MFFQTSIQTSIFSAPCRALFLPLCDAKKIVLKQGEQRQQMVLRCSPVLSTISCLKRQGVKV